MNEEMKANAISEEELKNVSGGYNEQELAMIKKYQEMQDELNRKWQEDAEKKVEAERLAKEQQMALMNQIQAQWNK